MLETANAIPVSIYPISNRPASFGILQVHFLKLDCRNLSRRRKQLLPARPRPPGLDIEQERTKKYNDKG